jgi:hypothetical protein
VRESSALAWCAFSSNNSTSSACKGFDEVRAALECS